MKPKEPHRFGKTKNNSTLVTTRWLKDQIFRASKIELNAWNLDGYSFESEFEFDSTFIRNCRALIDRPVDKTYMVLKTHPFLSRKYIRQGFYEIIQNVDDYVAKETKFAIFLTDKKNI